MGTAGGSPVTPPRRVVLALTGALDGAGGAEAHTQLLRLELRRGDRLALDLRGVTSMDSMGVRFILQAHQHALQHGAGLVVVRGPAPVMRVLDLVGLSDQLETVARL